MSDATSRPDVDRQPDREAPVSLGTTAPGQIPSIREDHTEEALLGLPVAFPYARALMERLAPPDAAPLHLALQNVLEDVALHGTNLSRACEKQSISVAVLQKACEVSDTFADALRMARGTRNNAMEEEAYHRAVEGNEEVHYDNEGNVTWTKMVYSDSLMKVLLQAEMPDKYAPRQITEHTGDVKIDIVHRRQELLKSMQGANTTAPALSDETAIEDAEVVEEEVNPDNELRRRPLDG